jgi:hypothetical protein
VLALLAFHLANASISGGFQSTNDIKYCPLKVASPIEGSTEHFTSGHSRPSYAEYSIISLYPKHAKILDLPYLTDFHHAHGGVRLHGKLRLCWERNSGQGMWVGGLSPIVIKQNSVFTIVHNLFTKFRKAIDLLQQSIATYKKRSSCLICRRIICQRYFFPLPLPTWLPIILSQFTSHLIFLLILRILIISCWNNPILDTCNIFSNSITVNKARTGLF